MRSCGNSVVSMTPGMWEGESLDLPASSRSPSQYPGAKTMSLHKSPAALLASTSSPCGQVWLERVSSR